MREAFTAMSDTFYELASDLMPAPVLAPPIEELLGFTLCPGHASTGKSILIRHACGWRTHLEADPEIPALYVVQTMHTHLLMRECGSYRKDG